MGEVSENERHEKETRAAFLSFLVFYTAVSIHFAFSSPERFDRL